MRAAAAVFLVYVAATVVAACGGSSGGRYAEVQVGVCDARRAARAGDAARGAALFEDAHAGLHTLADATSRADRAAAARLLEAKQQVEADVAGSASAGTFAEHLDALVVEVGAARRALGEDAPSTCE